ncbi:MAG: homocysteine S-methyltransferase family protein [Candidatus Heimdallarchaeota archaeon]|nr:homocysteine S-methyltransferase family protein [Candidatus Heimdallarchaeota archaeon]
MKPILLDGPMGTEIERRGGQISDPLWSANGLLDNPDMIREIHVDYIKSGSTVITTNTFRTQERTFQKVGLSNYGKQMTQLAVELAQDARRVSGQTVKIAGSISPLEDCYSPQLVPDISSLKSEHGDMTNWLFDAGIDLFLIETMNSIIEAKVAFEEASKYDLPIWLGMTVDDGGNLLSGESWQQLLQSFPIMPEVVFVNCSSRIGTNHALQTIQQLKNQQFPDLEIGFYPNFLFELDQGRKIEDLRAELYDDVEKWIKQEPKVIGSCCGATPEDTEYLSKLLTK